MTFLLLDLGDATLAQTVRSRAWGRAFRAGIDITHVVCKQVTEALAFLHRNGVAHRGVCTENVWVYRHPDGRVAAVKLAGLGKATRVHRDACTEASVNLWDFGPSSAVNDGGAAGGLIAGAVSGQRQQLLRQDCRDLGRVLSDVLTDQNWSTAEGETRWRTAPPTAKSLVDKLQLLGPDDACDGAQYNTADECLRQDPFFQPKLDGSLRGIVLFLAGLVGVR